jgi:uncharacterized protein YlzI (FlbEa/FlbD family)
MKSKFSTALPILMLAVLALTGCGKREYKPMAFSELTDETHHKEYIELTGTVKILTSFLTYGTSWEEFYLAGEEKGKGGNVSIHSGTEKNQMKKLPKDYSAEDLEITDMNGKKIHVLDKVKVRGKIRIYGDHWILDADEIEKIE